MMHVLDYDRALGELLELDDTIRASIERGSNISSGKLYGSIDKSYYELKT
jgi:hypothetical protein